MSDRKGNNSLQPSLGYADLLEEHNRKTPPKEKTHFYPIESPTDPNKLIYVSTVKSDKYSVVSPIKLSTILKEVKNRTGITLPTPSDYNKNDNNVTLYAVPRIMINVRSLPSNRVMIITIAVQHLSVQKNWRHVHNGRHRTP